ncbi:CpaF family protein [Kitasatospora sp. NPDC001540]|uniref:CpaF family protein n=1 Tax=Kitasatospora sp. NPDC001540 TaxID=3364014 RepID=UPI0036BE4448
MLRASPVHNQPVLVPADPEAAVATPAPRRAVVARGGVARAAGMAPGDPFATSLLPTPTPAAAVAGRSARPAEQAAQVDPAVVSQIRRMVADELATVVAQLPGLSAADREQRARAMINNRVATWVVNRAGELGTAPGEEVQRALEAQVFDLLFRAGRLQPYLDDAEVENILVNGCDDVVIDYADRGKVRVGPIAESDEDLVELLRDLARRSGHGERTLSTASPMLALRLPDGSRLQAMTEVTPRPQVTIRRHRVRSSDLAGMVELGAIDSTLAAYLKALVLARKNVLIAGGQGAGKTSLMRAMAREIPKDERIGTLETEFELFLHELEPDRQIVAMEAREGNGERVDGQAAGEITVNDLIYPSLRMNLSRIVVGEVRGREVVPMLQSMTNGEGGSLCTIHAREAGMVYDRIAELYMQAGEGFSEQLAYRQIANGIDAVVFLRLIDETAIGGRRHRFVSQVLEVTGAGENGRPTSNTIFGPNPELGELRAVPRMNPTALDDLVRVGFNADLLRAPAGTWRAPLDVKVGR